QLTASNTKTYTVTPKITGAYQTLPQPNTTYVATGCDGLPANSPDTRFPATLPGGPYQITKYVPYNDDHSQYTGGCGVNRAFTAAPIHRFYQMWQQTTAACSPGWPTRPATTTARSRRTRSSRAGCRPASTTWPRVTRRC